MYKHSKEDSGRSLAYHISVLDVSVDASDASGESEMKYYSKLVNQGLYDHEVNLLTSWFSFVMFLSKKSNMTLLLFKINVVLMCY